MRLLSGFCLLACAASPGLAGPSVAASTQAAQALVSQWLTQGRDAFEQRRYPQAMDMFLRVLEVSPGNLESKKFLLEISRAAGLWERRERLRPGELEQAQALALRLLRRQRESATRLDEELDAAQASLKSQSSKALLSSSFALSRDSEQGLQDAHFAAQARRYLEQLQQRLRAALRHGEIKDPKDMHAAKGFLYYERHLWEPALEEWQEALSLDPADEALKEQVAWLGEKIRKQQDGDRADALAREAQKWYKMGQYEKAVQRWTELLALDPKNGEAIAQLEQAQRKKKQELLDKRIALAREAAQAGGPVDALQRWVAVLEVDPVNAEALAAIHRWRQQQPASKPAAAKLARRAASKPKDAEEQYAVGMAYYSQGELPQALEAMRRALEFDPALRKAQIAVERIHAELGE